MSFQSVNFLWVYSLDIFFKWFKKVLWLFIIRQLQQLPDKKSLLIETSVPWSHGLWQPEQRLKHMKSDTSSVDRNATRAVKQLHCRCQNFLRTASTHPGWHELFSHTSSSHYPHFISMPRRECYHSRPAEQAALGTVLGALTNKFSALNTNH